MRSPATALTRVFRSWLNLELDLKLALRMLLKYPGLTLIGGLSITVAVAVGVGFYALFHSRFYPDIPLSDGDRLVGLQNWNVKTIRQEHRSLHDFVRWRDEMQSVEDLMAFRTVKRNVIAEGGSVEPLDVAEITPSGFRLARVPPLLGRTLVDADAAPGAPAVIVIGFDVWRTRFGSASDIVGRDLRLGRTAHSIVGVMPEGFAFPVNHRLWTPLRPDPPDFERGKGPSLFISGRLAPGVDLASAHAELTVIGDRMAAEFPDTHAHLRPEVAPYTYPFLGANRNSANAFWPVSVLVSLILVVVCVNIAVLIYARTATRLGEIAVRSALGASRGRIVAQLSMESLVLSFLAGAVGLFVVKSGLDWARASVARVGEANFWNDYSLPASALVYVVVLTVLAACITGVLPALRTTGRRVQWNLTQFNSRATLHLGRTWTMLIVVQVAVASAALPIAVALGWLQLRDIFTVAAFPVEQMLFAEVALDDEPGQDPAARQSQTASWIALQTELSRRLDAEAGVASHSFTSELASLGRTDRVAVDQDAAEPRRPGSTRDVARAAVDLRFFRTFDTGVLAGRAFRSADHDSNAADVVVVNRAFAGRVLDGHDVLGRRIRYVSEPAPERGAAFERWYEIVGVVENIDANPFGDNLVDPRVYHPMKIGEANAVGLAVRFAGPGNATLAGRLPSIAAALDPALRVTVIPLGEAYRLRVRLLGTSALAIAVALMSVILLAAAGIYAMTSFTVVQRRREIAIRTALGAAPGRLLGGIFTRALRQIAVGVAIGIAVAFLLDASEDGEALRGRAGLLLSSTAVLMCTIGLVAALGPARRGLRIAPSEALKGE